MSVENNRDPHWKSASEVFVETTQPPGPLPPGDASSEPTIQTIADEKPEGAISGLGIGVAESAVPATQILTGLKALKRGDFDARLPGGWTGTSAQVADTFNELAELLARSTEELTRI